MNLSLRRFTVLAAAMVAMLALSVSAAFAQSIYPPEEDFAITCTDATPGGTTQCSVVGAAAGEVLTVTASEDGRVFATFTVTADDQGRASFSIDIPADVLGVVLISVSGPESGTATDTIMVAEAGAGDGTVGTPVTDSGGALPMTGTEVGVLFAVALTLLGGGLLALRRREDSKVAVNA